MDTSSSEVNPLDALAEEFVARHRRGEHPTVEEYAARIPALAGEIRELFPGLLLMEGVRPDREQSTSPFAGGVPAADGKQLERLGDYRILREVGRGGMGVVYEAEQESLGRHVALKVLPAHMQLDAQRLQRFRREARAAGSLHHTNIVPVFGVGDYQGLHYYVMQFIQGLGLDQVLRELHRLKEAPAPEPVPAPTELPPPKPSVTVSAQEVAQALLTGHLAPGLSHQMSATDSHAPASESRTPVASSSSDIRLPGQPEQSAVSPRGRPYWQSVARMGQQVAAALAYAHAQGTLHRDIKPSNLLLDTRGTVWVTDFGLAKASDSEDLTHTGDVVGTIRYMAPERFQGKSDSRSDVYSLGLTLYELLTLRPAYVEANREKLIRRLLSEDPPPPRKLNPEVPRDLETVVLKAMAREQDARYQTAADLADDLERFVEDRPILARRVGQVERLWRWCRRNPAVASLLALVATGLVAVAVGATLTASRFRSLAAQESATAADLRRASEQLGGTADRLRQAKDEADRARTRAETQAREIQRHARDLERLSEANALMQHAGSLQGQGKYAEAHAALSRALELRPDHSWLWGQRSNLYLLLGLFPEAVDDWARANALQEPSVPSAFANYALVRCYTGDAPGFRAACKRALERFGKTAEPAEIGNLVLIAALVAEPAVPAARLVGMAQVAVARLPAGTAMHLPMAAALFRAGRYAEAKQRLDDHVRANAQNLLHLPLLAMVNFRTGNLGEARRVLDLADQLNEQWTVARFDGAVGQWPVNWVTWLVFQIMHREAKVLIEKSPPAEDARLRILRSRALAALNQDAKVEAEYAAALKEQPANQEFRMRGFQMFGERGLWKRANGEYAAAVHLAPKDPQLHARAFRLYAEKGQWPLAETAHARAIALRPEDPAVQLERFGFHAFRDEWARADEEYARALRRRPRDAKLRAVAGSIYFTRNKFDKAEAALAAALRLDASDAQWWNNRAVCLYRQHKWSEAVAAGTQALRRVRDNPVFWANRGDAHAELGLWKQASGDFARAMSLSPFDATLRLKRALVDLQTGRTAEYQQLCSQARISLGNAQQGDVIAHVSLIFGLAPDGLSDYKPVLAVLKKWEDLRTKDYVYLVGYSAVLYRAGQFAEAVTQLDRAETLAPKGDVVAGMYRAMAEYRLGYTDQARQLLARALAASDIASLRQAAAVPQDQPGNEWQGRCWLELVRREAEALINSRQPRRDPHAWRTSPP
jgi:serine/threonine protein kinase/predicted Zn-dependent protease